MADAPPAPIYRSQGNSLFRTDAGSSVVKRGQDVPYNINGAPTVTVTWGEIGGTLADQADLQAALDDKADLAGAAFTGAISATNLSGTNTGDQDLSGYATTASLTSGLDGKLTILDDTANWGAGYWRSDAALLGLTVGDNASEGSATLGKGDASTPGYLELDLPAFAGGFSISDVSAGNRIIAAAYGSITGIEFNQDPYVGSNVILHAGNYSTVLPVLASGTYTPTLANTTNVAASTAFSCQYLRVGNTVTVSGRVDIDPTTAAISTELRMSLPIATNNFTAAEQAAGVGSASTPATMTYAILGLSGAKTVRFLGLPSSNANAPIYFSFTYKIV